MEPSQCAWDNCPMRLEAILLETYHAAYIAVPKVACTTLKTVFAQLLNIDLKDTADNPHCVQYPRVTTERIRTELFAFGFVRNPWDRLVSCYRDKILGEAHGFTHFPIGRGVASCLARYDAFVADMRFDVFVGAVASIPDGEADNHFRSQYTFFTDGDEVVADFVGRYETLAQDFYTVARRIGLPNIELPRLQAARPARYQAYYNSVTRRLVAQRFREYIEIFGYQFAAL
jgi:chondroitin 4-sulfotransferase 11